MMKSNYYLVFVGILIFVGVINRADASKDVIVKQVEKSFKEDVFFELYPDKSIWENADKRQENILGTDLKLLEETAKKIGQPPETDNSTLYIKESMFRVDSESSSGEKMTVILRKDKGMMYQIDWKTKKVHKMSMDKMKEMQKTAQKKVEDIKKNIPPGLEGMLAQLPKEQQEAIQQAMGSQGYSTPEGLGEQKKPTLTETGNKKDIKKFLECVEFRSVDENETTIIWAHSGKARVSKIFHKTSKNFKDSLGMDENEIDPLELLPKDKFPVLILSYRENMMSSSIDFETNEILSVEETEIPLNTFEAYNDPELSESTEMELMEMK